MKIPIFEEINFENFERETLREKLQEKRIGKVPTFINIMSLTKEDQKSTLLEFKSLFLSLNLNPRFPYPCYMICEFSNDNFFPTSKSIKELPSHFFKKVKRPNNKELQLLNKLSLKVDKINNLELNRIEDELIDTSLSQKRLYNESKELYFLEIIHHKLTMKEKSKNGKKA